MKRIISLLLTVLSISSLSFASAGKDKEGKFMFLVSGSLMLPSDSGYKEVYGSSVIYPGLELDYMLFDKIYILFKLVANRLNSCSPLFFEIIVIAAIFPDISAPFTPKPKKGS